MNLKINLCLILAILCVNAEYISYKNYKVYGVVANTDVHIQILEDLKKDNAYEFWTDVIRIGNEVSIMVSPQRQEEFERYMKNVGITAEARIQNIQELIDAQLTNARSNSNGMNWDDYQTLDTINAWLIDMSERYPNIVKIVNMGKSTEDRDILGVEINYRHEENPVIGMIEGGIHAREWISPATVTWIINEFLTSNDPQIRFLAENIVWHLFPVTNPDGYFYTFTTDRLWRKTRNPANFVSCGANNRDDLSNGVDLNRNFDFVWNTVGTSPDPCAQTFPGPVAFSEPESNAIAAYVQKIQTEGHLLYYFAFHSYSQMVLVPYSHVGAEDVLQVENYGDLYEIAMRGMEKLKQRYGTEYIVGVSMEILYGVSGSSFDWVKGVAKVPIVYLFELRPVNAQYGFMLPKEQIIENNLEIMDGLIEMDRVARRMGYYTGTASSLKVSASILIASLYFLIS